MLLSSKSSQKSIKRGCEPEEVVYIGIASVSRHRIEDKQPIAFSDAPGGAPRIVRHGDVIWSCVRPNRRSHALVLEPEENLIVSSGFAVLRADGVPCSYLYFAVTKDEFVRYLTNHARGPAYPAVGAEDFERALVLVPPSPLSSRFHEHCENLLTLASKLGVRNENVRVTRDLLMPRLLMPKGLEMGVGV